MAWFALSFRAPWASHRADSPPQQQRPAQDGTQHERFHTSTQAIESYTVRILDPSSRPSLHTKLRQAVEESGGVIYYAVEYITSLDWLWSWESVGGRVCVDHENKFGEREPAKLQQCGE
ncbi:hypothetical protein SNOG_13628 [Parastagonospora nodorum SN15]|uniref:Uncharacterized protein n=1 Tax=Phaeosphaeria nodorum (strain SN15 / ATCC MYA-4574 / FGSC 10173) TaxID=321614 RepID=Q0U3N6_PHANO|nr:hypothetical protein SNOG_13628 [Parastagonospora nodorum SN15]EAT79075.1 hypothetical protein SNOG_13628 [Parastagonospora nodorum SN15]